MIINLLYYSYLKFYSLILLLQSELRFRDDELQSIRSLFSVLFGPVSSWIKLLLGNLKLLEVVGHLKNFAIPRHWWSSLYYYFF